jgi:4-aminobutyrate aminotransferase/diaminobutyrate-pyruvate transaminase/4-aminobutyrate aminotransferase/(S)-3-amino-2-methylpropionate transaminase
MSIQVPKIETKHRRIVTPIPVPESVAIIEELARYEPRSMGGHPPVVWDRAEGYQVFDPYGNCWIDFSSAVILANAGHAHEKICAAITEQINRKLLHNYCFPSKIRAHLLYQLVDLSPSYLEKVFLLTTGSEAVECAIKLTRMYGRSLNPEKIGIVSFTNAFHGRTLGSQMIGGFTDQKEWIVNLDPDMFRMPFPNCFDCPWGKEVYEHCGAECFEKGIKQLRDSGICADRIAGFITETYQGPTVAFLPDDYVKAMRYWADRYQALLTFDEVQSGFGRTGKMFGFEYYGVEADMICCGKGITSSLPLSAVIGRTRILDIPGHGQMSSTHTGNPLCCAAASANIEVLRTERLVERAVTVGKTLENCLTELQKQYAEHIGCVSGKGLVSAVWLIKPGTKELDIELAHRVTEKALQKGLLMLQTGRGTLKIAPPLSIPEGAIIEGVSVIAESISECI